MGSAMILLFINGHTGANFRRSFVEGECERGSFANFVFFYGAEIIPAARERSYSSAIRMHLFYPPHFQFFQHLQKLLQNDN